MDPSESEDEARSVEIEYFAERMHLVFAFHFFHLEFQGDETLENKNLDQGRTWSLFAIHNACLHSALLAVRDIDDFFYVPKANEKSKRMVCEDDMKAQHFGYTSNASFLSDDERKSINKRIAHLSTTGVMNKSVGWDIPELVTKAVSQGLQFLDWVVKNRSIATDFMTYTAALGCSTQTKRWLEYLTKEVRFPRPSPSKSDE